MAVFFVNICKYNGCGKTFPDLAGLIQHIEHVHIDYDPIAIEQHEQSQPSSLPLSYVLSFFGNRISNMKVVDSANRVENVQRTNHNHLPRISAPRLNALLSGSTSTSTGSEADDELRTESEDSNDSWSIKPDIVRKFIIAPDNNRIRFYEILINLIFLTMTPSPSIPFHDERPHLCPVQGCNKRYKSTNSLRSHARAHHNADARLSQVKKYACYCGKNYATAAAYRHHVSTLHSNNIGARYAPGPLKPPLGAAIPGRCENVSTISVQLGNKDIVQLPSGIFSQMGFTKPNSEVIDMGNSRFTVLSSGLTSGGSVSKPSSTFQIALPASAIASLGLNKSGLVSANTLMGLLVTPVGAQQKPEVVEDRPILSQTEPDIQPADKCIFPPTPESPIVENNPPSVIAQ